MHGADKPQQLVDRLRHQGGLSRQSRELVGVLEERQIELPIDIAVVSNAAT